MNEKSIKHRANLHALRQQAAALNERIFESEKTLRQHAQAVQEKQNLHDPTGRGFRYLPDQRDADAKRTIELKTAVLELAQRRDDAEGQIKALVSSDANAARAAAIGVMKQAREDSLRPARAAAQALAIFNRSLEELRTIEARHSAGRINWEMSARGLRDAGIPASGAVPADAAMHETADGFIRYFKNRHRLGIERHDDPGDVEGAFAALFMDIEEALPTRGETALCG